MSELDKRKCALMSRRAGKSELDQMLRSAYSQESRDAARKFSDALGWPDAAAQPSQNSHSHEEGAQ